MMCQHEGGPQPTFDEAACADKPPQWVREHYPRVVYHCPCGESVIRYESFLHYLSGDW